MNLAKVFLCLFVYSLALSASAGQKLNLIPWPKAVREGNGALVITKETRIVTADKSLAPLAAILSEDIWRLTAQRLAIAVGRAHAGDISLELSPDLKGEAYEVSVNRKAVVKGGTYQACAWGAVTLVQLLNKGDKVSLPGVSGTGVAGAQLLAQ